MTAESATLRSDADDPWRGSNPLDPAFRDDPYPSLRRLREVDPVNLTPIGFWRLTRCADVMRLLYDVPAGTRTTDRHWPGVHPPPCAPRPCMPREPRPARAPLGPRARRGLRPRAHAARR